MYTNEDIRKVQLCALDILKDVAKVLEQMGITYYALAGTALGARRHNGFIPWDDDLDIGLIRADYDRFLKDGQDLLPKHLFIQDMDTEEDYYLPFAKVRNTNTLFVEQNSKDLNINHGVFIDIFPIDYAPDDIKEMKKLDNKIRLLKIQKSKGLEVIEGVPKKIIRKLITTFNLHDRKYYVRKIQDISTSTSSSKHYAVFGEGMNEYYPKEYFDGVAQLKFEDILINVPKMYNEYLEAEYGDFMTPPPVDEQKPQHQPVEIRI